jgi:riboflavin kinase/FMN adenylyltransferase
MRISSWEEFLAASPPDMGAAMTVGVFDGIHRGHRALFDRVLERKEYESTVITFRKSPKAVLRPGDYPGDICTLTQKLEILESLGITHTVLIDFSRNFSILTGREFIEFLAEKGKLRCLVVGSNFRCGYRMDTGIERIGELLSPRGIPVEVIESLMEGSSPVSSSRIRTALAAGDLDLASRLLGRPFELDLEGLEAGSAEGLKSYQFPAEGVIAPPPGVYQVLIRSVLSGDAVRNEIRAELCVDTGRLLVSSPFDAGRIEFLSKASGRVPGSFAASGPGTLQSTQGV